MSNPANEKTEIEKLRATIYEIDCLAHQGFSEIIAVAKLALLALENPKAYRHPEHIAQAFVVILGRAADFKNTIGSEAENVGGNYQNKSRRLREGAWHTFNDGNKAEGSL